jgi:hypothetical protein
MNEVRQRYREQKRGAEMKLEQMVVTCGGQGK